MVAEHEQGGGYQERERADGQPQDAAGGVFAPRGFGENAPQKLFQQRDEFSHEHHGVGQPMGIADGGVYQKTCSQGEK